jgi:hypothetical protein
MLSTLVQLRRLQGECVEVRTPSDTIQGLVLSVSFHSVWLKVDGDDVIVPLRKVVAIVEVLDTGPGDACRPVGNVPAGSAPAGRAPAGSGPTNARPRGK